MTLNGKRDDFVLEDYKSCAKAAAMKRGRFTGTILGEVQDTVSRWPDYAEEAVVNPVQRDQIDHALRLGNFQRPPRNTNPSRPAFPTRRRQSTERSRRRCRSNP